MRLQNHIAYRFLNDEKLLWEIMELVHPDIFKTVKGEELPKGASATWQLIHPEGNKTYYITESVTEKLELLKVKRKDGKYDYTIFNSLTPQKCTFILPDNRLVRMMITENTVDPLILFDYIRFVLEDKKQVTGNMNNCLFFVDRVTGEQCEHFSHPDVVEIEDYLYKLLCFIYLSEVEEVVLKPGQKMGTRRSGKIINDIRHDLTVINSKWNITSIRTEGFQVSGHFQLQPYGPEMSLAKVIWIDLFQKNGYVRKAQKENVLT